jgi:hypothetical protein
MTKHLLRASLAGSSLLLMGLMANAQDRQRIVIIEKEYHQAARDDNWWRGRLFQHVRDDLNHVQAVTSPFSADEYRLTQVKNELNELQTKLIEKRYDQPELDDVISAMERVVNDNRLTSADRDMLKEDLDRLRQFRDHHEGYR